MDFLNAIIMQVNVSGQNVTMPVLPPLTLANAFGDLTATLILIVLMIAMTIRTSSEYIEKLVKGEAIEFNRKYLITAGIAFITSLPIAMGVLPEASKIFLAYFGQWGLVGALLMVGVYGYGWNHGTNKLASLIGHFFMSDEQKAEQAKKRSELRQKYEQEKQQQKGGSPSSTESTP